VVQKTFVVLFPCEIIKWLYFRYDIKKIEKELVDVKTADAICMV
jgi:hypothetical protein